MKKVSKFLKSHYPKIIAGLLFVCLISFYIKTFALTYTPGETLDPNCAPGASCIVQSQEASLSSSGVVNTGAQVFGGQKVFMSTPLFPTLNTGSILFMGNSGALSQDNSNLFWNNTSKTLSIGTDIASPNASLNVTERSISIGDSSFNNGGFDFTLQAGNTTVGGTNITGGNLILSSGKGTGTGTSSIYFNTGTTLGVGTTLQTLETKMIILGNGNVGIGTTLPVGKLDLVDLTPNNYTDILRILQPNISMGNHAGNIQFGKSANSYGLGSISYVPDASTPTNASYISFGLYGANDLMVVKGNGNVGIGTANPTNKFEVSGGAVKFDNLFYLTGISSLVTPGFDSICRDPISGQIYYLTGGGNCNSASSIRFKQNVVSLSGNLEKVLNLHPVSFNYKNNNKEDIGFIAEEVEKIEPRIVIYGPDGVTPFGLNYDRFTALLAGAVQELNLKVDAISTLDLEKPNSVGSLVKQFLADASNDIADLYAKVIHSDKVETKSLCIGDDSGSQTCLSKAEVDALKSLIQGQVQNVVPQTPVENTVSTTDTGISSSADQNQTSTNESTTSTDTNSSSEPSLTTETPTP